MFSPSANVKMTARRGQDGVADNAIYFRKGFIMSSANEPKSFLDKAKSAASNFAANAKAAGQIAAKQAERTKITQVTLPSAYLKLGTDIHGAGRFRDEFGDRYAKADDLLARIAKLREAHPAPSEPQKLTDRAKATAGHAKDFTTAKALEVQVHSVLRELGKSAFEKHGDQSGPSGLTTPIADALSRIAAIDAEISQISESHKGGFLTPKRVLFGGVAVIGLVLLLCLGSMVGGDKSPQRARTEAADASAESNSADDATPKEPDFAGVDYTKGPEGQPIVTRDGHEVVDGDRWEITEQGYMKGEEFVPHGTKTIWYKRPTSNSERRKATTVSWFAGEEHGPVSGWHKNGKLRFRNSNVHGKLHGTSESWYENEQMCQQGGYKEGKKHGKWTDWYDDGKKQQEVTYSDDNENGVLRKWHPNGQLAREETFVNGTSQGPLKIWREDGQQKIEGNFDKGKKHGTWIIWFPDTGSPKYTLRFSEGKLKPCSKEEFVAALWMTSTGTISCNPRQKTFAINGLDASSFFATFGPPARDIEFNDGAFNRIWVYSCTDGDLQMSAAQVHPSVPIAIKRLNDD